MQKELEAEAPGAIRLLGVNGIGLEADNATMTNGRVLPWLQDVAGVDVWTKWGVTYRDVVILDATGTVRGAYNLTVHDLNVAANRDELKAQLKAAR